MKNVPEIQTPKLQRVVAAFVPTCLLAGAFFCLGSGLLPEVGWMSLEDPVAALQSVALTVLIVGLTCYGLAGHFQQVSTLLTEEGIWQRRVLGPDRFISWEEVARVEEVQWVLVINSPSEEVRILPHLFKNPSSVLGAITERLSAREDVTTAADSEPKS